MGPVRGALSSGGASGGGGRVVTDQLSQKPTIWERRATTTRSDPVEQPHQRRLVGARANMSGNIPAGTPGGFSLRSLMGRGMERVSKHINQNLYAYRSALTLSLLLPVAFHARRSYLHTLRRCTCASQLRAADGTGVASFRGRVTGWDWHGGDASAQRVLRVHHVTRARRLLLSGDGAAQGDAGNALLLRPFGLDLGDDGIAAAPPSVPVPPTAAEAEAEAGEEQREQLLRTRVRAAAARWIEEHLLARPQLVGVEVVALLDPCRPRAPGPVVGLCSLEFKASGGTVLPWGRRRDVALEMVAAGAARVREEPNLHTVPSHAAGGVADDCTDAPVVDVLSVEALQLLVARLERLEEAQTQAQAEGLGVWEGNTWKAPPSGAGGGSAHVLRSLRDAALERVLPPIIQRVANWRHRKRTSDN